jgi:hypothetical protein
MLFSIFVHICTNNPHLLLWSCFFKIKSISLQKLSNDCLTAKLNSNGKQKKFEEGDNFRGG